MPSPAAADLGRHARGKHLLGHDAELLLHRLELADRLAELRPVVGIGQRGFEHALHRAGHQRGRHQRAGMQQVDGPGQRQGAGRLRRPVDVGLQAAVHAIGLALASGHRQQCGALRIADQHPVGHHAKRHVLAAPRALRIAAALRRQRQRPAGCVQARQWQHGTHPGRLGQRHRQRMAAAGQPQREGFAQPQAGATGRLVHQQLGITRSLDLGPQRRRALATLHLAHHGGRAAAGQEALDRFEQQGIHQRNPSPRAITPRRISRVPPRSEKVGQTCST